MARILVALDGSDGSRAAVETVKRLSGTGSEMVLFTVLPVPMEVPEGHTAAMPWRWPGTPESFGSSVTVAETRAQAMDRLREEAEVRLDSLADEFRQAGFKVTCEVAFGSPVEEILIAAGRLAVDAVAVSTHGHTGLRATLLGSVASELIRSRRVPVIVAPIG